jgi:hypothetical protein
MLRCAVLLGCSYGSTAKQGMACDVFINELIPHIDGTYRTIADRSGSYIYATSVCRPFCLPIYVCQTIRFPRQARDKKTRKTGREEAFSTGRGIEGFSQGGRGTVRYMFAHPELFCSAAPGGSGLGAERAQANDNGVETSSFEPPVVRRTPII